MFESSFPYSKINFQRRKIGEEPYIEHNYSFKGASKKRYLVIAEQYNYFVYAIKFCLQEHKYYSDRFNRLSSLNECSRVITTIGKIMKDIYLENPYASFGFIGSNLVGEQKSNTKRFRLYSRIISELISPVNFEHRITNQHSAYLMVNREYQEPDLLEKIESLFKKLYEF